MKFCVELIWIIVVLGSSQTAADSLGNCSTSQTGCCLNYYKKDNKCVACPDGYYDKNCSQRCPPLRYGNLCGEKCDCSASLCHHVHGCPHNNTEDTPEGFWDKWWVLPVFSVSGGLLALSAITGILVFCFRRKKKTEFNPKHMNNASQRRQSRRENGHSSQRRACVEDPPAPCAVEPTCGSPMDLMVDNYENPYAMITDTARLMPRTRHTPKVVSTPMAPLLQQQPNSSYKDDSDSYDILSLKVGLQDEIDMASSSMTSTSGAHWAKKLPTPMVKKPPAPHRTSFLFPADSSGYIPSVSSNKGDRSSEAEIQSLPMPPPPPSNAHLNGFIKKKGKKPPLPPQKPPKGAAIYSDNGGHSTGKIIGSSNDGELESETESKQINPNNVCRRKKSLKTSLLKDAMNKRKTNGKSYNLSGLLEIEDMPLPEFDEGETSCHGSRDPLQNNGVPQTNMLKKCQTALKSKMNRISALKLTSNTLENLRYSFARPQK